MGQIKVEYRTFGGSSAKAYIDEEPDADGWHSGTNKHSDAPVEVRWSESRQEWIEQSSQPYREAQRAWWADKRNWM